MSNYLSISVDITDIDEHGRAFLLQLLEAVKTHDAEER